MGGPNKKVNFREKEKQILDKILGPAHYDRRIRPSGVNGTGFFLFFSIYINLVCGCLWLPHLCTPPLLFDSLCLLVRFCRVDPAVVHLKHNLLPSCLQMDPPSSISTSCFEAFPPSATTKWYVYNRPMIKINTKLPLATSSFLLVVRPSVLLCVCTFPRNERISWPAKTRSQRCASWRDDAKPQEGANQREEQL